MAAKKKSVSQSAWQNLVSASLELPQELRDRIEAITDVAARVFGLNRRGAHLPIRGQGRCLHRHIVQIESVRRMRLGFLAQRAAPLGHVLRYRNRPSGHTRLDSQVSNYPTDLDGPLIALGVARGKARRRWMRMTGDHMHLIKIVVGLRDKKDPQVVSVNPAC